MNPLAYQSRAMLIPLPRASVTRIVAWTGVLISSCGRGMWTRHRETRIVRESHEVHSYVYKAWLWVPGAE